MAEQDVVLSREVAIAAKLDENGIAVRAKSRAVAAFDRLVGSLFDVPAAFFEGVARKKRLRDEIGERLKNAQARMAEQQIEGMPALGVALIHDLLEDKSRKQINTASVVIEAIDVLKTLPPPEPLPVGATAEAEQDNIDEDWMNQFVRFAEDASSERLQQIWGRVLAGEMVKPRSFSRHTLRFISELDGEAAENCEFVGRHVVKDWLLNDEKWQEESGFLVSIDLQRLGVLGGVGTAATQNFTIGVDGTTAITGKSWGILVRGTPGISLSFPVFVLTRMGQEVMSLLNVADEAQSLREVAGRLDKTGLESIALGEVIRLSGNQVAVESPKPIWQATGNHKPLEKVAEPPFSAPVA